jgi:hypothetical protein
VGDTVGFADLAEDFGFAEKKRIESGGNAEEVTDGGAIVVLIEKAVEHVGTDGVEFAEEGGKARSAFVRGLRGDPVEFATIAGGEDQGFFEQAAGTEFVGSAASLFEGKGDALANVEWCGAMV